MNFPSDTTNTLTDAVGVRHEPAEEAPRIVSFVPSITELLFDLDLGDQLVGRTHYCVHPVDKVKKIPCIGGTKKINLNRLKKFAPTHVIVNIDENTKKMVEKMTPVVPHVIVTHPVEPGDNLHLFKLLGAIFAREQKAEDLCKRFSAAFKKAISGTESRVPRRVLYLIWKEPWMTVSADTYISRMLATIGWQTVAHDPDTRYPEVTMTDNFLTDVDLVLFSSEPFAFTQSDADTFNADHPGAPRALFVDGEMTSWYGSRAIEGLGYLDQLAKLTPPI
jgi:ABC-type Fe3+-hydroxamate transport system substrate-binding protein